MRKNTLLAFLLTWLLGTALPVLAQAATITISDHQRGLSFSMPRNDWPVAVTRASIKMLADSQGSAYCQISNVLANANTSPEDALKRKMLAARTADANLLFSRELEKISFPGGVEGTSVMIESPSEALVYRFVYAVHQGYLYEVLFVASATLFNGLKQDFSGILKSLQFYQPDKDVVTVTHGGLGVTLDAPARSDWSILIDRKPGAFGDVQDSIKIGTSQDRAFVTLTGTQVVNTATLTEAYSQHVNSTRAASPDLTVFTENRPATVGGIPALEFSFKNTQQRASRHFVLIHQGQVKELQFEAADALFEEYKPDFSDILKGITFQSP
jgi:hypothetical protein